MASRLLERLRNGPPIVADGGMGALISAAVPRLRCPEEANLRAPDSVTSVHVGYIRAGAELIETNTFGANRRKLAALYLEDELRRINEAAVKIARDAREMAGHEVFIAGSIGPLGQLGSAAGEAGGAHAQDRGASGAAGGDAEDQRGPVFAEQAELLEGKGVDLFILETFFDLEELVTAVEAVSGVSSLPIVALLTFDEDGETVAGVNAREAAERLKSLGVAAVGANHGSGPQAALTALEQMSGNGLPLAAMPNLGLANLAAGRIVYPHASPDYFADFAAQAHALGAQLIGGCCGTTPSEIAAIKRALDEHREVTQPIFVREREPHEAPSAEHDAPSAFAQALSARKFAQTIEINPPMSGSYAGMLDLCRELQAGGTEFIDVTDNYTARARMNPMIASAAIEATVPEVETIPHLTPRDMTVMGLESILLGAHAAGLRNILAITGDPPAVGDYPGSQGVYEVDAIGLCRIMKSLNKGESFAGKLLDAPTSFFYGVAVNPTADDVELELRRFEQKIEAGAQFAITQSLFDLAYLDEFERKLGGWPIPVLLGVFFVTSYPLALRLHNEIPGMVVPDHVQERFRDAGPRAPEVGLEVARELVARARDGKVAGVEVIAPFKAPLRALEVLS